MCNENTCEVCLKTQPLSICNYCCVKKQKLPKEKTAQGQTGHWSAGGEQLHCASLALDVLLLLLLSLFLFLFHFINLSLSQHTSFYFFSLPILPPIPLGGGSKQPCGAEPPAGLNPNTREIQVLLHISTCASKPQAACTCPRFLVEPSIRTVKG